MPDILDLPSLREGSRTAGGDGQSGGTSRSAGPGLFGAPARRDPAGCPDTPGRHGDTKESARAQLLAVAQDAGRRGAVLEVQLPGGLCLRTKTPHGLPRTLRAPGGPDARGTSF